MLRKRKMKEDFTIHTCNSKEEFAIARTITQDYLKWLKMDLNFQNTKKEFQVFEIMYGKPKGCFIYATINGAIAGGVAIRKLDSEICEMKRLFVYNSFQGKGFGKELCEEIILIAGDMGYSKMRLDTVSKLKSAIGLYQKMGFYEIESYYQNPDPTVKYMEFEI
jgi:ribosomal protein S18 acetylase RimI-like enzyme